MSSRAAVQIKSTKVQTLSAYTWICSSATYILCPRELEGVALREHVY